MADVNDAHAAVAQPPNRREKILRIHLREAAGRLVHDQNFRRADQRARNFNHLLFRDGNLIHRRVQRQIRVVELSQRFTSARAPGLPIHESKPRRFAAQQNIFFHRQMRRQIQFLVNHRNAASHCLQRTARRVRRAVQKHFAAVRLQRAAQRFHQRAFARAIFANQRVNFPRRHFQRNAAQGLHPLETFAQTRNAQPRGRHFTCGGFSNSRIFGVSIFSLVIISTPVSTFFCTDFFSM
jgi:hypothetical protein